MKSKVSWQRLAADVVLIAVSLGVACTAHLGRMLGLGHAYFRYYLWFPDWPITPADVFDDVVLRYTTILPLLAPLAIAVFSLNGFYTNSGAYRSRYKFLVLLESATIAYVAYAALTYLVLPHLYVPRLIYLVGWSVTVVFLWCSRMWSATWRTTIKSDEQRLRESGRAPIERVLVVGGAGYIGSALVRRLLEKNYTVKVLDSLIYGDESIVDLYQHPRFELFRGDSRSVETVVSVFRDVDAVIHLGAIVGDSACAIDEQLTIEINLAATRMMAEVAKGYGVRRFVFASTCSVYGASDGKLDESSSLNPVSLYARSKIACEQVLMSMAGPQFCPVIYRLATIYGLSPRPRFDLAVNLLTAKAVTDGVFTVFGGDQWRPFVHVEDVARSLVLTLDADEAAIRGEVFNIGSSEQNCQMRSIGKMIERLVPGSKMILDAENPDKRNYWVRFDKASRILGFQPTKTLEDGIAEIVEVIRSGRISDYQSAMYNNFKYLSDKQAISSMRLNNSIFDIARATQPIPS